MATLDWTCETIDGVTLVELVVTGEQTERVRIESNLTPVWPPRRQGRPETGWDDATFEGTLDAEDSLTVGFASPATPVEPPAELTTAPSEADDEIDPEDVIRALGDGMPPRDAVPDSGPPGPDSTTTSSAEPPTDGGESGRTAPPAAHNDNPRGEQRAVATDARSEGAPDLPPAIEAYFDALNRQLEAAEQLVDPGTVEQAREAVTAAGGTEAVAGLEQQLRVERARLGRLEQRQQALASRLDAVEIPVERLDRLT